MSAGDVARLDNLQSVLGDTPRGDKGTREHSPEDSSATHPVEGGERRAHAPTRVRARGREGEEHEGSDEDIMSIDEDDLADTGVSETRASSMDMDEGDVLGKEGGIDEDEDEDDEDAAADRDEDSELIGTTDHCSDAIAAAEEDEDEGSGVRTDSGADPSSAPSTPAAGPVPAKVISTVGEYTAYEMLLATRTCLD